MNTLWIWNIDREKETKKNKKVWNQNVIIRKSSGKREENEKSVEQIRDEIVKTVTQYCNNGWNYRQVVET